MTVIAEITIAPDQFPLGTTLHDIPGMEYELDRVNPMRNSGHPYLWASGGEFDTIHRVIEASSAIDHVDMIEETPDGALYRLEWDPEPESLIRRILNQEIAIMEAHGTEEQWFFKLGFDTHEDLAAFNRTCDRRDTQYQLVRIYPARDSSTELSTFGLTKEQLDALVIAVDRGFFHVPRGVTLAELGEELGISAQATSERIRRATNQILTTVMMDLR